VTVPLVIVLIPLTIEGGRKVLKRDELSHNMHSRNENNGQQQASYLSEMQ